MDLQSTQYSQMTIITVGEARIDAAAAIRFKDAMRAATATGAGHVVLDLSNVTFVDSSGLGAIVAAMKQMGGARRLDLAGLTPDVAKVFRLTRMESVFTIHDDILDLRSRATG
ncbi:MAG: anti-anti-sigma factor [Roseovarius sp. BRH_c41]|uniref:STAS domain-containing protein n=1 Tax=Roseovarius sp. BRH_c41 TaxID=1629709 RepID=UPI0005F1FABE|nr:STAS domain-containing protein [Roseovarius sp. BRH_c41]KJS42636.1 MAG: anti-anti-sigma factor [Roseovarius sp. BRH_c41]